MNQATMAVGDQHRAGAFNGFKLLAEPAEERFERITRLARRMFNVSYAAVGLIDGRGQWTESAPELEFRETSRDAAFFSDAISESELKVVQDAWIDPRFRDNPIVAGVPQVRFYAAVQLRGPDGSKIGRLRVFDKNPRHFGEGDAESLKDLARMIEHELNAAKLNDAVASACESESKVKQLRKDAVSLASHELRQPLTVMRTALDAIRQFGPTLPAEKAQELLNMASRNVDRLMELVDRYLDLAKIESGESALETRPVELEPLIRGVVKDIGMTFAGRGVRFEVDRASRAVKVLADPDRLVEVLSNLLSNAGKFSPEGGAVAVSWTEEGGRASVAVTDEGPGIAPEFRSRIFGKFAQHRSAQNAQVKGTGLGLSIAKAIVERMGGEIGFETEVGQGTTFRFSLPAVKSPEKTLEPAPSARARLGGGWKWALAAVVLLLATIAEAATTAGVRQAIEAAVESNLTSKLAKADSDAARAQALQAASALLPSVIGSASQNRIFRENLAAQGLNGGPIPSLIGPYNSFDARLRLTQTIFDLPSIKRTQAAGAGKELAARQEEAAREQVAAAAALAYVEALRARKAVTAAEADLQLAARLQAQAEDQEKQGTATGVDVVRARTRSSDANVELLRAQVAERNALIRLKRVAGWPLGDEIALSDDLTRTPAAPAPLDSALSQAAGARPEIAAAQAQAREDELLLSAAKAERAPSVAVGADVGLSGNQPDGGARTTGRIGVGLSVPLFSGGLIKGRIEEAGAGKSRSEARLADIRTQVEEDVRLAYENLSEAQQQVVAAAQTQDLAEQELRMAQDQYAAGTGDNVAVVTAQTELAQARNALVSSLAGDYDARINLAAALGAARDFKL